MEDKRENDRPSNLTQITGFDIERMLRNEGVPKAFAKAVAAACRTAGLFNRCQVEDDLNEINQELKLIFNLIKEN